MGFFDVLKMLFPLALIIGMLYGLLIVVRKYSFSLSKGKQGGFKIRIVATQMILPKKFISVIKVKDKLLVLGVSESSINLLKEFDADEDFALFEEDIDAPQGFASIIKKNLGLQ